MRSHVESLRPLEPLKTLKSYLHISGLNEISGSVVQMRVTTGPTMLPDLFLKDHQSLAPGDPRLDVVLAGFVDIDVLGEFEYNDARPGVRAVLPPFIVLECTRAAFTNK